DTRVLRDRYSKTILESDEPAWRKRLQLAVRGHLSEVLPVGALRVAPRSVSVGPVVDREVRVGCHGHCDWYSASRKPAPGIVQSARGCELEPSAGDLHRYDLAVPRSIGEPPIPA